MNIGSFLRLRNALNTKSDSEFGFNAFLSTCKTSQEKTDSSQDSEKVQKGKWMIDDNTALIMCETCHYICPVFSKHNIIGLSDIKTIAGPKKLVTICIFS